MPDPTRPILHRLGDLAPDDVFIHPASSGDEDPPELWRVLAKARKIEGKFLVTVTNNRGFVAMEADDHGIRLIPETPLTKHAGEKMHKLLNCYGTLENCAEMMRRSNPDCCDEDDMLEHAKMLDGIAMIMRLLLSRIDAEGGGA